MRRRILVGLAVLVAVAVVVNFAYSQDKKEEAKQVSQYSAEVYKERVNVRIEPIADEKSTIVGVLKQGDKVEVVGEKGDWLEVVAPKGASCWISEKSCKKEGEVVVVTAKEAPLRADSRINAKQIGTAKEGDKLSFMREHAGWYKVQAPSSVHLWVSRKFVKSGSGAGGDEKLAGSADADKAAEAKLKEAEELTSAEMKKPIKEMDFAPAIFTLEMAESTAQSSALKQRIETKLSDVKDKQAVLIKVKAGIFAVDDKLDEFLRGGKKSYAFTGYIDSTGALLHDRPGEYKLKQGDKIVCFLKVRQGDARMLELLKHHYNEYVGVNGEVIENPPGWLGYKLVIVDEVRPIAE